MPTVKIKRIDVMFVLGAGIIIGEVGNEVSDRATLITGLILMGVPVVSHLRNGKNGDA
jgi:hypothetical protein